MFQAPSDFTPDFSKSGGLIAAVAQDAATGEAHYWSRSRQKLWHKGESSGNVQIVRAIRLDCDSDAVVLEIEQVGGAACHTGRSSCFYRRLIPGSSEVTICCPQVFDPAEVYNK